MVAKRFISLAGSAFLMLGLSACESEREHYFRRHVNRASQDAVAQRLGPPHRAQELTAGGAVWSYEYRDRSDCTVYILRFDLGKVLRDWNERPC
jgi:hypothetical protein